MSDINDLIDDMINKGEIGGKHEDKKRDLTNSLGTGFGSNPDQAAENDKLSRQTGFDPEYVERNKDSVTRDRFLKETPIDEMLRIAPVTSRKFTDPNFAKQAHDDVDNLVRIEENFRQTRRGVRPIERQAPNNTNQGQAIADVGRSFVGSPVSYTGSGISGIGSIIDVVTRNITYGLDAILPEGADKYLYLDQDSPDWVKSFAQYTNITPSTELYGDFLKDAGTAIAPPPERQNLATDIAAGVGQVGAQMAMAIVAPWSAPLFMAGAGADEQVQRQEEAGVYGDSWQADLAILAGAGMEGALEKSGLDMLVNRLPPKVRRGFVRYLSDLGTAGGIEFAEEALVAVGQNLIEYASYNPDAELFEGVQREAMAGGGTGVVVRAILLALPNSRIRLRAQEESAKIAETFAAIQSSKLNGRNKDLIKAYLQELAEDTGSDTLYVDSEGVDALFQTVTDQTVIQSPIMMQIAEQLKDAKQSGAKIEIPMSSIPELIDQGLAKPLMPYMTSDVDSMSSAMATDEEIQTQVTQLNEMKLDEQQQMSEIYEDIRGQELARGQSMQNAEDRAVLINAHYVVLSKRDGKGRSPEELYAEFNPSYKNEMSPELQAKARRIEQLDIQLNRLRDGDIPSDDQIFGDSLFKFIRREGGIVDEGGELAGRDLKTLIRNNTGRTLDDMAERAYDLGYISERDPNLLLDMIDEESRGNRQYSLGAENSDLQNQAANLNQLQEALDQMGLDITELTNEQIIEAINSETNNAAAMTQGREEQQAVERRFDQIASTGDFQALSDYVDELGGMNPYIRSVIDDYAMFIVDEPLPDGALKTLVERAARKLTGADLKETIANEYGGDMTGMVLSNDAGDRFAFFLPDASEEGKFRYQEFDESGFSSHTTRDSYEALLPEAMASGYRNMADPEVLNEYASKPSFIKGNKVAAVIQKLNSGQINFEQANKEIEAINQEVLFQAAETGYEGKDLSEAKEWIRAEAKGLDMSLEGRMARARAMGFDVDKIWYHGTEKSFSEFNYSAFLTENPEEASAYSNARKNRDVERGEQRLASRGLTEITEAEASGAFPYEGIISDVANNYEIKVGDVIATDEGVVKRTDKGWDYVTNYAVDYDGDIDERFTDDGQYIGGFIKIKPEDARSKAESELETFRDMIDGQYETETNEAQVLPVFVKSGNLKELHALEANMIGKRLQRNDKDAAEAKILVEQLKNDGYEGISTTSDEGMFNPELAGTKQVVIFDSKNIRSVNAAFDPDYADSPNILAQFAGEQSDTADLGALDDAQKLKDSGMTNEQVRQRTGWLWGSDGKWRYEISDDQAVLKIKPTEMPNFDVIQREISLELYSVEPSQLTTTDEKADVITRTEARMDKMETLEGFLDHPLLFAAYPQLADYTVMYDPNLEQQGFNGLHNAAIRRITLNPKLTEEEALSTLLHEVQHAIQSVEDFSRGGTSSEDFVADVRDLLSEQTGRARDAVHQFLHDKDTEVYNEKELARQVQRAFQYESAQKLIEYANKEKPSSMLRYIRNEMQWLYDGSFRDNKTAQELQKRFYEMPDRGAARNIFIRDMAFDAAQLLLSRMPRSDKDMFDQLRAEGKRISSGLSKELKKVRKELEPLREINAQYERASLVEKGAEGATSYGIYYSLAGELEARTTQNRQNLTPEERAARPIRLDQDMDAEKAIVLVGGLEMKVPVQLSAESKAENLPDRIEIIRMLLGFDGSSYTDLYENFGFAIENSSELFTPHQASMAGSVFGQEVSTAIRDIEGLVAVYSATPDRSAVAWDISGNVYRIIRGNVSKLDNKAKDGSDLSEAHGVTANVLSRAFRDIKERDPREVARQKADRMNRAEERRRQERLMSIPEMSPDFDTAIQELADWAENKEEFKLALSPSLFDTADRNRTRLGRATMALEPEYYENAGKGDVTIYRAMPVGEEIEAGDWVSFSEEYAAGHEKYSDEGGQTVGIEVSGEDVWWYGADENEWVYIPSDTWGDISSIDELWESLTEGKPDTYEPVELFQTVEAPKNLAVVHNLSAENILAANDLGGLAAPSIATIRADRSDFDSFGEVTLIADPSLLNSPKARTFDSDIYSPRQPRATYDINAKRFFALSKKLPSSKLGLGDPNIDSLEGRGVEDLERSDAFKYYYLEGKGQAPKLKKRKVDPAIRSAAKLKVIDMRDEKFRAKAEAYYRKKLEEVAAADEGRVELYRGIYFNDDGNVHFSKLADFESQVQRFIREDGIDTAQLRADINKKFRTKKANDDFQAYAASTFESLVDRKVLFKGFTPSGTRRYAPYNMDNVVKEMTKQLQGGEASFYGAGSVRSAYANEMKTIAQVQAKRDQIISEGDFTIIKEESNDVLGDALDKLKPFYKYDSDSFRYFDDAASAIMEGRKGINEAFNVDAEVLQIIGDLTDYLRALPTSYFETKIQRAVSFSEFNTAVVPKGMRKDALQVLKDAGLKIKTYDDQGYGKTRQDVVQGESKLLFQNGGKKEPDYRGSFNPETYEIKFTKKQNYSTFIHETGHLFLQNMMNMAQDSPEIAADMAILQKWWADNGATTYRQQHEMFASGFEQYGKEGKAPSSELRAVFGRFRVWITEVYRRLKSNPFAANKMEGVELSDEVRGVMDRMLATQDEIDAAKEENMYNPSIMESIGLTPEQASEFQTLMNAAEDEAYEDLASEVMAEYSRETQEWWRKARNDMREEVAAEVAQEKVYRMRDELNGDVATEDGAQVKLNRSMVKAEFGGKVARQLGRMLSDKGINPATLAYRYGYPDGESLVMDLVNSKNKAERTKFINEEADARMLDLYGDMLNDGNMADVAQKAVHSDKMADVLVKELALLDAKTNKKPTPRTIFKAAAEQKIGNMKVINIKPNQYLTNERRARSSAMRMAAKGDFAGASFEMRKAVYQHFMYKEAQRAIEASEQLRKYGKKLQGGTMLKNIKRAGDQYIDQIDGILGSVEMKVVSAKKIAKRRSMEEFIQSQMNQAGAGDPTAPDSEMDEIAQESTKASSKDDSQSMTPNFGITDQMLTEADTVNYRELTPLEQIEIMDMLKSTYSLAKLKTKLLTNQDKRTLAEHIDDLESAMINNAVKSGKKKRGTSIDKAERRRRFSVEMYDGSRTPTSLIRMFDAFEDNGVAWKLLGQPLQDAAVEETRLMDEANKGLEKLFAAYKSDELEKLNKQLPNEEWSKNDILSMFLNYGNAEGRDRVLNGLRLSEGEVNRLFERYIDERDVEFAKNVWKFLGTYKKDSFALHRDLFGFTPKEVEPASFMTKYGMVEGGYYPISYDTAKSAKAEQNVIASENEPFGRSVAAKSNLGSNKARMAQVKREINTDLTQVIFGHVSKVVHSISHDRALFDVGRLLASDEIKNAINDNYGEHVYKSLVDVVREIKFGKERVNDGFDKTMVWMRNNATFALLGASLRTIVLQPFGVTNSFVRLRLSGISKGKLIHQYAKLMTNMPSTNKMVREKSQYMSQREQVMNVAISRISQRIKQNSKLDEVKNWTMIPMQKAQFFTVDLPTWMVAYDHYIAQGTDEDTAIKLADQMVRDAQGGGSLIDTATSMQGNAWKKLFTNFLSYMMTTFTLQDQNYKQFKKGDIGALDFSINTLSLVMMPAILTALLNDFVGGEDDEMPWWERYMREQLSFILGSNIITAQFSGIASGFDYSGAQGTAIIRQVGSLYSQLEQGEIDEGMAKAAIATFGLAKGLPIAQINRSIGGVAQAIEEGDDPLTTLKKFGFGAER